VLQNYKTLKTKDLQKQHSKEHTLIWMCKKSLEVCYFTRFTRSCDILSESRQQFRQNL